MKARLLAIVVLISAVLVVLLRADFESASDTRSSDSDAPVVADAIVSSAAKAPAELNKSLSRSRPDTIDAKRCQQEDIDAQVIPSVEEYKARMQRFAADLSNSDDPELLLAAAMMAGFGAPGNSMELLNKAFGMQPENALIAWNRLMTCRELGATNCDFSRIAGHAIKADGDNGAVWLEIAMHELSHDRLEDSERSFRRAIAAPSFDSYLIEQVTLVHRALELRGDRPHQERMVEAFGVAAANLVSYSGISRHCSSLDDDDGVWLEVCEQLGSRLIAEGRTLMDMSIGYALKKIAAKQSGDQEGVALTTAAAAGFREGFLKLLQDREAQNLLENDEAVYRQYVDNFATYGELEAQMRLHEEAKRLREDASYDPCNFKSRWIVE